MSDPPSSAISNELPRSLRTDACGWKGKPHAVRADWLKVNGLKGALTELTAMVWPHIGRRLVHDPDASIGTPRRVHYRALPQP
jgi:hypothetical protein